MPDVPVITHWSLPPQHVGYWPRLGGGDGWPERGGAGPNVGPHIPGLVPGWHAWGHVPQRVGLPMRAPRGPFIGPWGFSRRPPRRPNAFRPVRFRSR